MIWETSHGDTKFKVGDLVVYNNENGDSKPTQLDYSFVYKIQAVDDSGGYFLLPKDNYLGISGCDFSEYTWRAGTSELQSLSERPEFTWGEDERKMYGEDREPASHGTLSWDYSSTTTLSSGLCGAINPSIGFRIKKPEGKKRTTIQEDLYGR
jgi:hypothetical protein